MSAGRSLVFIVIDGFVIAETVEQRKNDESALPRRLPSPPAGRISSSSSHERRRLPIRLVMVLRLDRGEPRRLALRQDRWVRDSPYGMFALSPGTTLRMPVGRRHRR